MAVNFDNTSGTVANTRITVQQLIDFAYRNCNFYAEQITPELVNAARQALYYDLINLTNKGVNLWLLDELLLGSISRQRELVMPKGVSDIREFNYFNENRREAASSDSSGLNLTAVKDLNTEYTIPAGGEVVLGYPNSSFLRAGFFSKTPNATLEVYASDAELGVYEKVLDAFGPLSNSGWAYKKIDASPEKTYWKFVNNNTFAVDVNALVFGKGQNTVPIARLNRNDYYDLPNKNRQSGGNSLQFYLDRGLTPTAYLWTVPNTDFELFELYVEYQMMDVGKLTNEISVPDRWIPYVQAKLSHSLSMQLKNVDPTKVQMLKAQSDELFHDASNEDRDRSPIYLQPNISPYTR